MPGRLNEADNDNGRQQQEDDTNCKLHASLGMSRPVDLKQAVDQKRENSSAEAQ